MNLFDALGNRITGVSFGPSTTFFTFDNTAGLSSSTLPLPTLSTLSVAGANGAFLSVNGLETGSPGVTLGGNEADDLSGENADGLFDSLLSGLIDNLINGGSTPNDGADAETSGLPESSGTDPIQDMMPGQDWMAPSNGLSLGQITPAHLHGNAANRGCPDFGADFGADMLRPLARVNAHRHQMV